MRNLMIGWGAAAGAIVASLIALSSFAAPSRAPFTSQLGAARVSLAAAEADDLATVETWTRRGLAMAPMDAEGWGRLAWIADRRAGRCGPDCAASLTRSYAIAPYGPDVSRWRTVFVFNRWSAMTPPLRRATLEEFQTTLKSREFFANQLRGEVTDPAGRLALAMGAPR